MRYTIILPMRNEAKSLPRLLTEIRTSFRRKKYGIIAVDDASDDETVPTISKIRRMGIPVTLIHTDQDVGKWESLRLGIAKARGQIIIFMDADLQDDPCEIPRLIKKINAGYDVASGWRKTRNDDNYKIFLTKLVNAAASLFTEFTFHDFGSSMKVFRREALLQLPMEGSLLRYSFLLAGKMGMKIIEVPVVHHPRIYGESKFGIEKYFRMFYDLILILLLFRGSGRLAPKAPER